MAAQGHGGEMPQYLVDVDCFKFNSRIVSLSSYLSDNVDVLEQLNHNLYKQGIISNEEREEVLKTPLGNEKALSLTKAIETALTRSPESLPTVIEELRKFEDLNDIIDSMTIPQVTDEEFDIILKEIEEKMLIKIEELEEKKRKGKAMIDEKMKELMKLRLFGNKPVVLKPITTPRYSTDPNATVEDHLEWMKSEFEQLTRKAVERKEFMLRLKKKVDRECDEIMEEMDRRGDRFNEAIANSLRLAEERSKEIVEKTKADLSASNQRFKDFLIEIREYHNEQKKYKEEMFDRRLEREKEIEAFEEALDSETYDIKIEKSYKSGLVPKWTHPSLIKTSYTVTPVYRTIEEFEQKKNNDEIITLEPFYTTHQGYKMTLAVYPNGLGLDKGSHVSVYIYLMKGDNDNVLLFPFSGNIIIKLLNWTEDNGHVEEIVQFSESTPLVHRQRVTDGERAAVGCGVDNFLSHVDLYNNKEYLHYDKMCFTISFEPIQQTGSPFPSWYNNNPANITQCPPCIVTMYQYSLFKNTDSQWNSTLFYTSERGYKLQLVVYANGSGLGKGTHLSVYVVLMKGEYDEELKWPFNANITIQLLNWSDDSNHIQDTIPYHEAPVEYRTRVIEGVAAPGGMGYGQFVSHSVINNDNSDINYINEDKLCFEIISIDIID